MKTEKIPMLVGIVIIILLAFLIIWKADIFGVSESRLEQDAREKQKIDSTWDVAQAVNEDIGAMLFYDEDKKECNYSIYLSRSGVSYGYFYAQGGQDDSMANGVKGIAFEEKGIVLLSLNGDKVCKVVIEEQSDEKVIQVDPEKPFVLVVPVDCNEITMYDAQDQIVTLYDTDKEQ